MTDGIVPTLAELIGLRDAAQRRVPARRGRHGIHGASASPLRGRGMEYAESREYSPGDDVRHIDWRLTARSGHTHTKLFQAERERLTLIVADTSPALYFGTRTRFKSVQAARAGAIAAWAALRDGDRIAALRGSKSEAPLPPMSGTRGVLRVLDALTRWYTQPPADDAGLSFALEHATRVLRPGSRLVVLADASAAGRIGAGRWGGLAAHHEVVLLLPVDALEQQPPQAALAFAAAGARIELDLRDNAQWRRWQDEFVQPARQMREELPKRGVRVALLPTDAPSDAWLPLFAGGQAQVA